MLAKNFWESVQKKQREGKNKNKKKKKQNGNCKASYV